VALRPNQPDNGTKLLFFAILGFVPFLAPHLCPWIYDSQIRSQHVAGSSPAGGSNRTKSPYQPNENLPDVLQDVLFSGHTTALVVSSKTHTRLNGPVVISESRRAACF
jgi:hypothetical protein